MKFCPIVGQQIKRCVDCGICEQKETKRSIAMDRESVITHLQIIHTWAEFARERDLQFFTAKHLENIAQWADDSIALLKEQKAQKWNLLTEDADGIIHGLPGDDGQYLMTDGKNIWIDDYVDGVEDGIILDSGRDIREITAWMYMPELPKKDRR